MPLTSDFQGLTIDDRLILAGTGHRPDKLGGYGGDVHRRLQHFARALLERVGPSCVISGMALAWDQALAEAALVLRIPVVAALPCDGQESRWPAESRARYHRILDIVRGRAQAGEGGGIVVVSPGPYEHWKMQARNVWMVDRAHVVAALWDGSPGGTGNCVRYAFDREVPVLPLWRHWARGVPLDRLVLDLPEASTPQPS